MDPNQFRENRVKINTLCQDVEKAAVEKDVDVAQKKLEKASTLLEELAPEAEGEIQERSVRNLGLKIKNATLTASKLKTTKTASKSLAPKDYIKWDEKSISELAAPFLEKLLANMGSNPDTTVCFSTTGKGVKPSYQVYAKGSEPAPFSGSSHKPLKRKLPEASEKISAPFPQPVIQSILSEK